MTTTTSQPDPAGSEQHTEEVAPHLPPRPEDTNTEPASDSTSATSPQQPTHDDNLSPEVAALKSMFPDFDPAVLQSILESVNFNQERAIDVLLGMSDPSYVSSPTREQHASGPADNDTSLDEAIARQLALEDEEERRRGRRQPSGQTWPRRGAGVPVGAEDTFAYDQQRQGRTSGEIPYEVRTGNRQQSGYVTGNERGDFQEFQETVSKIAESGKRTFASVVSKIKSKLNEFEQNGGISQFTGGSSSEQQPPQHSGPPTGTSRLPNPAYASQGGSDPYSQTSPTRGVDRHTASQAYAPPASSRLGPDAEWEHATAGWRGEPAPPTTADSGAVKGYDIGETPTRNESLAQSSAAQSGTPSTPPPTGSASPRGSTDVAPPPSTQSGSPINAAKFGLLPKRPVSLLGSQPPSETKPDKEHDDDDEELEYLENPFEDDGKKR